MIEQERVQPLYGPYRPPRCAIGGMLRCAIHVKLNAVRSDDSRQLRWCVGGWMVM